MTEYFIVKGGRIINCVTTSKPQRQVEAEMRDRGEDFDRLDPDPPMSMLERYQYWHERP